MQRYSIRSGFQSTSEASGHMSAWQVTFRRKSAGIAAALIMALCVVGIASCATRSALARTPHTVSAEPVTGTEITDYKNAAWNELVHNILPYWLKHGPNKANGGFYGNVTREGKADAKARRGALLTSRTLWAFSAAFRITDDPQYLKMAKYAYADLKDHFEDTENGGYYWIISAKGKPVDTRKVIYGQAFAIYSLSEYYRATGDKSALDRAIKLYRTMETYSRDKVNGGYREEFSSDWKESRKRGRFGSAISSQGMKSQNVHIHILEAYTNLYRAWPDKTLRNDLCSLQDTLSEKILNAETHHLGLFFSDDWKVYDDTVSYGHDIEFSWLLVESAEVIDDPARLEKAKAIALEIAQVTADEGVDADGGVFNEGDSKGLTDTNKEWWPQAEAVIGFTNAWTISGNPKYFRESHRTWNFIESRIVDHKNGEWFRAVNREGKLLRGQDTIAFWKCPYHNTRVCIELIDRLEAVQSKLSASK